MRGTVIPTSIREWTTKLRSMLERSNLTFRSSINFTKNADRQWTTSYSIAFSPSDTSSTWMALSPCQHKSYLDSPLTLPIQVLPGQPSHPANTSPTWTALSPCQHKSYWVLLGQLSHMVNTSPSWTVLPRVSELPRTHWVESSLLKLHKLVREKLV